MQNAEDLDSMGKGSVEDEMVVEGFDREGSKSQDFASSEVPSRPETGVLHQELQRRLDSVEEPKRDLGSVLADVDG